MNSQAAWAYPSGRILVFAKAPVAGRVKTRLAARIGAQRAAELHAELVRSTLLTVTEAAIAPVELHVAQDQRHPVLESLATQQRIKIVPQQGADLGQRMSHALQHTLVDSRFALIIGTDCPVMTAEYLEQACRELDAGTDIIIGPAEDGGYVLIGMRHCRDVLFRNIPWGSGRVMEVTRQRLRQMDARYMELKTLWDIDRPEDLDRWRSGKQAAVTG
ncbi:TIGR04282 family arsenosugar biosynthesis glycosyltransferase [Thiogranum longum]